MGLSNYSTQREREDDEVRPADALLLVEVEEEGNDLDGLA